MAFRYVALIVCALVALYALERYHKRRGVELEQRHAKHHGWDKFRLHVGQDVWECPHCGALFANFRSVQQHRHSTESACAARLDALKAEEEAAALEDAGAAAEQAGRWSVSATVVAESHAGDVDTWARPELESAEDGQG